MNLIFLGPPGAGKGTQAQRICWEFGIAQISTGDLLRSNISKGTPIGIEADKYINDGNLVPDELIIEMIKEELQLTGTYGYLLDGFPRTLPQAIALDSVMETLNGKIDIVLQLDVPNSEILPRLTARRTCPECGKSYHLIYNPPAKEGKCDIEGATLFQRKDDNEETVSNRLKIYENQTLPIIDYYRKKGLLTVINGVGRLDAVYDNIKMKISDIMRDKK